MRHDRGFVIEGLVDGRPSTARWVDGRLEADDELRRRAEVIVGLGEEFALDEAPAERLSASLDGGLPAALLTVLRAFSAVTVIDVDLRAAWDRESRSDA